MKTTMNKVMIVLQALAAATLLGAIKIWAPVCGKLLELVSGKQVPMKCHWAGQAAIAISVIIIAAAVMALLVSTTSFSCPIIIAVALRI